jgi:hypothetical protein
MDTMDIEMRAEDRRMDIETHVEDPKPQLEDPFIKISNMFPDGRLAGRPVLDDLKKYFDKSDSDSEFIEALTDKLKKFEGELVDFLVLPIRNIFGFLYFLFSVAYGPHPKLDKLIFELILIEILTPSDDKSSKRTQRLMFLKLCKTAPVIDALFSAMSMWIHNALPESSSSPDKIEFIISGGILVTLFARFLKAIITCFEGGDTPLTPLDAYTRLRTLDDCYKEIIQQLIREFPEVSQEDITWVSTLTQEQYAFISELIMWVSSLTQENYAFIQSIQSTASMPITDIDIKGVLGKPSYSTYSQDNIDMIRKFLAKLSIDDIKGPALQNELFEFFKYLFPEKSDLTITLECFLGRIKLDVYNGSLAIGERQELKKKRIHHEKNYKAFASQLTKLIANKPKSTFTGKQEDTELVKNFFDLEVLSGLYPSRVQVPQLEFFMYVHAYYDELKKTAKKNEIREATRNELVAKQTLKFLYSLLLRKQRNIQATEVNTITICNTYQQDRQMLEEIKFMKYIKGYIDKINTAKKQFLLRYESTLSQHGHTLTYDNIVNCFMSLDTLIRYEGGLIINLLTEIMKNSLTFDEILETMGHILYSYKKIYKDNSFKKEPGKNIGVWSDTPLSGFKTSQELATMKTITRNPIQFSYQLILESLANKLPETEGVKLSLLALQTHTSADSAVSPVLQPPSTKHTSPVSDELQSSSKKHHSQKGGTIYSFNLLSTSKSNDDTQEPDYDIDNVLDGFSLFGGSKIIFVKSIKKSIRVKTRRRKQQKQKSRKLRKQKSRKHKSRKQKSRKHKFL